MSAKVTPEQFEALSLLARDEGLSDWVRRVLLSMTSDAVSELLLAEVLALRTIVVNLHFSLAAGETLTVENVRRLIDRTDLDKLRRAREMLGGATGKRP